MRIEIKGAIMALGVSLSVLGLTFGFAPFLRSTQAASSGPKNAAGRDAAAPVAAMGAQAQLGHSLYERNCAHCHGDDSRGDEGPTLYNLAMSDARISKRIKEGIKGEMPRFASKLNDADIAAVTAYLRTLKD